MKDFKLIFASFVLCLVFSQLIFAQTSKDKKTPVPSSVGKEAVEEDSTSRKGGKKPIIDEEKPDITPINEVIYGKDEPILKKGEKKIPSERDTLEIAESSTKLMRPLVSMESKSKESPYIQSGEVRKQITRTVLEYGKYNTLYADFMHGNQINKTHFLIDVNDWWMITGYTDNSKHNIVNARGDIMQEIGSTTQLSFSLGFYDKQYGLFGSPKDKKDKHRREYNRIGGKISFKTNAMPTNKFKCDFNANRGFLRDDGLDKSAKEVTVGFKANLESTLPQSIILDTKFEFLNNNIVLPSFLPNGREREENITIYSIGTKGYFITPQLLRIILGLYLEGTMLPDSLSAGPDFNRAKVGDNIHPYLGFSYQFPEGFVVFGELEQTYSFQRLDDNFVNEPTFPFQRFSDNFQKNEQKNNFLYPDVSPFPSIRYIDAKSGVEYQYKNYFGIRGSLGYKRIVNYPTYIANTDSTSYTSSQDTTLQDTTWQWHLIPADISGNVLTLRCEANPIDYLSISSYLELEDTENRAKGKVPYYPKVLSEVSVKYDNDEVATVELKGRYVGKRYTSRFGSHTLPDYFTMDFNFSKRMYEASVKKGLYPRYITLLFSVENLFSKQYNVWDGYEVPTAFILGGVSAEW